MPFRQMATFAILAGLIGTGSPGHAAECQLKQAASIPAAFVHGRIVLDTAVDGDPVKMLLDTGSPFDVLAESYVARRLMPVTETRTLGYGLTGKELHRIVRVSQLTLGNTVARDPVFLIGTMDEGVNGDLSGIFGTEYLARFDVEIDPDGKRVNLFIPSHCAGAAVYWAPDFFEVPVRLTQDNHLEVPIEVDGKALKAMIDTGAPSTTMRLSTARDVFGIDPIGTDDPKHRDMHGMDGIKIDAFPHTFHSMTFGGITLNDTQMIVADIDQGKGKEQIGSRIRGNHEQPDVIVGMSLLHKLHLFIAYSEPAVYFTLAEAKTAPAH